MQEKCHRATLSTANPTNPDLGSNRGHHGMARPACDCFHQYLAFGGLRRRTGEAVWKVWLSWHHVSYHSFLCNHMHAFVCQINNNYTVTCTILDATINMIYNRKCTNSEATPLPENVCVFLIKYNLFCIQKYEEIKNA